jgi:polyisoprenoid-binding protein YceI
VGVTALLDPDQVVDADAGERRELRPSQAGRAPARTVGQADLGGSHGLASAAKERAQFSIDHPASVPTGGAACRSPLRASLVPVSHDRGRSLSVADMTTASTTTTTTTGTPPLAPGTWALDTNHTSVGFSIRRLGLTKVRGHFRDVSAELMIGPTLDNCSVTAAVALASVDTGNADRDAHLCSVDLLDVNARPTMSFRSTGVRGSGSDWAVDGELTIGDVTRPITLAVEVGGVENYFDGTRHVGFEASGEIRRKDFGLGFGPLGAGLGDVVKIELDVEFVEPT